jgi:hypothetical protein
MCVRIADIEAVDKPRRFGDLALDARGPWAAASDAMSPATRLTRAGRISQPAMTTGGSAPTARPDCEAY